MAKYSASPFYSVVGGIEFNVEGTYETESADEIALLDALSPTWIKQEAPEEAVKPAPKPRKAPANTSAK
ncbi:hypothetical protein NST07_25680 [Paenibacillus sp. FSL L8-0340]|uniref:hypothetical protein n=1 Tax=Paenibacillus sp. FSL L8-0340 TaxID=2954685 RepID=UPI003158DD1A